MLIALLPVALIIFLVLIILSILAALFGSDTAFYQSYFVLPFDTNTYTITSPYGERNDPFTNEKSFHSGIDVVPTSSNIVAIADGTVVVSDVQEVNGEHVVIEHRIAGQVYRSGYYHLKENSRAVNVGDTVKQGQQIGIMGSTGKSTGTHLHFSLQKFNATSQKFDYTDPSMVINNNVSAKEFNYFDYNTQNNNQNSSGLPNPYYPPNTPTLPTLPTP